MNSPQVSVVMPVYNAESYLSNAVNSILGQTFSDFEFLIFDDGSSDRSSEILQSYAGGDDRIRVFAKTHRGYVPWLNEGMRIARGEFIARMDADDVSLPQRLICQVEYLLRHPDCVAVGCNLLQIDSDGDPLGVVIHDTEHDAIEADLLRGGLGVISHPACMLRRSALRSVGGYREEYEYLEDFDLWLRLAENGRLANIPEILFQYRLHYTNVIYTKVHKQRRDADRIIAEARERRGLPRLTHSIWSFTTPSFVGQHQTWAWQAAGSGYHRTALKHAFISLREAPLSPKSWVALCVSVVPQGLRHLLKNILVSHRPARIGTVVHHPSSAIAIDR